MITCPKCSFEQPKDRFCAKCGVNMDVFAVTHDQSLRKVGSAFTFYGLLIGLIAGGLFLVFLAQRPGEISFPDIGSPEKLPDQGRAIPSSRQARSQAPTAAPTPQTKPSQNMTTSQLFAQFNGLGKEDETALDDVKNKAAQVEIEFVTFNREVIDGFNSGSQGRLESGIYSMAIQTADIKKLEALSGYDSLTQETRKVVLGQAALVFRGIKVPKSNETLGLYVDVTPIRTTERGAEYTVSIKRSLADPNQQGEVKSISVNFDETLTIPNGATLAIAGLIPRRPVSESEYDLYKASFLKVMGDSDFQSGEKDFVLLIKPHFVQTENPQ